MRGKRLFLVALPVLALVLGIIFVRINSDPSLHIGVVGFTNINGGSQAVQIRLTNNSAGHFVFEAHVQSFSDRELRHLISDTRYQSSGQVISPRSITPHVIDTFQNDGVIRLCISYRRVPSNFQNFLNLQLMRFGLGAVFKPSDVMEVTSEAIPLPSR